MKIWKRNAVVGAIVVFVCVAVYLNWNYGQNVAASENNSSGTKLLGDAASVVADTDQETVASGSSTAQKNDSTGTTSAATAGTGTSTSDSSVGYFAEARLNREQARDSAITLLQQAAADEKASQTVKDDANKSIQTMATYTTTESQIENLVTAKGFSDCICFMDSNSVKVVVAAPDGGLTEADSAKIMEIVKQETSLNATQIKIIQATS